MIILDTNVVSETMKPVPEPRVIDWLNRQELSTLHPDPEGVAGFARWLEAYRDGLPVERLAGERLA